VAVLQVDSMAAQLVVAVSTVVVGAGNQLSLFVTNPAAEDRCRICSLTCSRTVRRGPNPTLNPVF